MGKFNFGIDATAAASEELGDGFYAGDTPPKGNYHGVIKQAKFKLDKNGNHRMNVLVETAEAEDSEKAEYNGAALWYGQSVTGEPMSNSMINNFLDAIGAKRKDFWDEKITTGPGKPTKDDSVDILKIGTRKVVGHAVFITGQPESYNGNESFNIKRFLEDDGEGAGSDDSAVEPGEEAAGLEEPGEDETAAEETTTDDGEEGDAEKYTEEELDELEKPDLVQICKEWELTHAKTATKATLIKLILAVQEEPAEEEPEAAAEEEPAADADETPAEDALTEEDLEGMNKAELVEYMTEKGWDVPTPAIPSRMRKAILEAQAAAPF